MSKGEYDQSWPNHDPKEALLNWQLIFAISPFGPAVLDGDCLKSLRFTGSRRERFFSNEFLRAHLSISRSYWTIVSIMDCKLRVRLLVDLLHCHG